MAGNKPSMKASSRTTPVWVTVVTSPKSTACQMVPRSATKYAAQLRERDQRDRTRAASPLVAAADAVLIDSTHLPEDQVLQQIEALVDQKLKKNSTTLQ